MLIHEFPQVSNVFAHADKIKFTFTDSRLNYIETIDL